MRRWSSPRRHRGGSSRMVTPRSCSSCMTCGMRWRIAFRPCAMSTGRLASRRSRDPSTALLRPDFRLRATDRGAGGQHLVQHARRTDRLHAPRRGRVLLDLALDALVIGPYLLQKPRAPCDGRSLGSGADLQPATAPRPLPGGSRRPGVRPIGLRDRHRRRCGQRSHRHQVEDWRSRCLPTGPTIHYLPVRTRTVRPPPAMPGGDSPRGG